MRVHIKGKQCSDDEYMYKGNNDSHDWCYSIILIVNIIGLTLIAIVIAFGYETIFFQQSGNSGAMNLDPVFPSLKPDVHREVEELFSVLLNGKASNITNNEETLLKIIFDAYDVDDDDEWSLEEFQMFMDDILDEKTAFHVIDINGDGILSHREVIAFLQHLHYMPMMEENFRNQMAIPIQTMFHYSYDTDVDGDNKVDQIWFEYAAQFLFWDYDPNQDGYITFDEWVFHQTSDAWFLFNLDEDSKITFDEFVSGFIAKGLMAANENAEIIHSILDFKHTVPLFDESEAYNIVLLTNMNEIYQLIKEDEGVARRLLLFGAISNAWRHANTFEKGLMVVGAAVTVAGTLVTGGALLAGEAGLIAAGTATEVGTAGLYTATVSSRVAAVGAESAASKSCFGEHNGIYTANRGYILVKDLMIGDYVLSGTDNQYSKVWSIDEHNHEEDPDVLLVRIWFNVNDFITITPDHLVYTRNDEMTYLIRAAEFNVGDELIVVKQQNNYTHTSVDKIDHVLEKTRNPVTMNGNIVINGILASSYSYSIQNANRLHHSARIFRWISNNISCSFAAIFAHFGKNIVFKAFEFFGLETIFDYYYTVPMIFATITGFIALFIIFLTNNIQKYQKS